MSHFMGCQITREVIFPGRLQFLGSNISREAKMTSQEVPFGACWVSFSGGFEKIRKPGCLTTVAAKIKVLLPRRVEHRASLAQKSLLGTSWRLLDSFAWGDLDGQQKSGEPRNGPASPKKARPGCVSRPEPAAPRAT